MATLFLLPILSLSSEEEQDPMPASAKRTVAQHDREVQRLKERYLSDLAEIREDTLRDLERDMEKTTRRGDLEGALAIKEKIEALEEQEAEIAEAPTDFLGNSKVPRAVRSLIDYYWSNGSRTYVFHEGGTGVYTKWSTTHYCTWTVEDGNFVADWGHISDTIPIPIEGDHVTLKNSDGRTLTWQREEKKTDPDAGLVDPEEIER